jgi:alkylresorcinol/alkylpyrone synthase
VTFAAGEPKAKVLLVSLELCSLTFQRHDLTKSNLVAAALFGDGAAAALVVGDEAELSPAAQSAHGLCAIDGGSTLWDDSLDVMGWEVNDEGLRVIFSRDIPQIVEDWLRPELDSFLGRNGVSLADGIHLGIHPGGPRVLSAYQASLGLLAPALEPAAGVLRDFGNMSSPTCLFVADRLLQNGIEAGEQLLLLALGPGFSAEYSLLKLGEVG